MRTLQPAELCMLLLFAPLGDPDPMAPADYRSLEKMLAALGTSGDDPAAELTLEELLRLGQTREGAADILRRLDREDLLRAYLSNLDRRGIQVLTRVSPGYPPVLRQKLGDRAPMLLFCAGNLRLLRTPCLSLVGSRALRGPGRRFAAALGRQAAEQGFTLVSGGAAGADAVGASGAFSAGGSVLLFLPDSLVRRMEQMRRELATDRLLLVSLEGPEEGFSAARAHARNTLIHAMGEMTFVAQTGAGRGGTWSGSVENLARGYGPLLVSMEEPADSGARELIARGGVPVTVPQLSDLRGLREAQTSLFTEESC